MTTRRGRSQSRGAQGQQGLQLVGPDGLPPSPPREDADPVDDPGSGAPGPPLPPAPTAGPPPGPPGPPPASRPVTGPATIPTRTVSDGPRIPVPARPAGPGVRPPRTPQSAGPRPSGRTAPTGPRVTHPATYAAAERIRSRAEGFVPEDSVLAEVRVRAADRGVATLGTGAAAALSFLAATARARSVVEIGTGLGVGTVSLLRGMPAEGILTTIDTELDHQRAARTAAVAAGFSPGRLRMITGRALEVLPRLSDAAYDLVVVDAADAAALEYPRYLDEAVRLLRPGGVLALAGVLAGFVTDERQTGAAASATQTATARDAVMGALRETARAVREDDRLVPVMLPLSEGLLCAAVR